MDGSQIAERMNVHTSTANRMINDFVNLGLLRELTGLFTQPHLYFEPYVKLF